MGLFSRKPGFLKPGKGIEKDAKEKNAFFKFFELLYRKFTKLFLLNIVYFLLIFPVICGAVVLLTGAFQLSDDIVKGSFLISNVMQLVSNMPPVLSLIILLVDIVFFGPLTAGYTYIIRNYVTEEHAWFSDMFSRAKANFKQAFCVGVIDVVVFTSVILYFALDLSSVVGTGEYYFYITMKALALIIGLVYVCMRFYIYPILITFELSMKDIMKNSAIFTVLGFIKNVLALVIIVMTVFAFTSTWIIDVILLATFTISFCSFIGVYLTYPVIQKYMLEKDEDIEAEGEVQEDTEE